MVGERDAEVRDLAYKDLLPNQIVRAQHALQALQDHLTEQHMRQLLGAEPLQAILGAMSEKEENDKPYYIQMIASIDPVAVLQQEEQGREEGGDTGEVSLQHRAEEILAAIQQRKQQSRRQQQIRQQQQHVTTNDNNDDNGRTGENNDRRRIETPRRQEEDTTAETRLAIVERQERGELQVRRRRRRRLVVATTTTVLACLSTVTTSLSHFVFTTLPLVAQQLQVASNYVSWRQVERLQLIYNYSCQAGDYYRSYYRTTLELYHNMTTTPVINVDETAAGTPSTTLPPLRAPKVEALTDWTDVKSYLVDNLVKSHLYNFDYKEASQTVGTYYSQFNELRLPTPTDSESESEEELQSMIQTHYLWSPFHYSFATDPNPPRNFQFNYYTVVEDSELDAWEATGRTTLTLSDWKSTTSKVFQHIHLHEHPLEALNYVIAMINNSVNERLHLIALNLYPKTTVDRNLMHYYQREGSNYKELENHSNTLQEMTKFTTSTTVISGPNYDYVVQMLTPAFYSNHLVDTTTISGPDHINYKSVKNMFHRHYDKTMEFLQKVNPDYLKELLDDEETTGETTTTTSKKRA